MSIAPLYIPGDPDSEAFPANAFTHAAFRAAYWRASNRTRGGILLTGKQHAGLSTDMLHTTARQAGAHAGLLLGGGSIVIIGADGNDELRARV